jgi:hypothetical protein
VEASPSAGLVVKSPLQEAVAKIPIIKPAKENKNLMAFLLGSSLERTDGIESRPLLIRISSVS